MIYLNRLLAIFSPVLIIGCATSPSTQFFDSAMGNWSESCDSMSGRVLSSKVTIVDNSKATYTGEANGRVLFYSTDDERHWEGFWIEDGRSECSEEKDGSKYWGIQIYEFNESFTRYKGSWDMCGTGRKYSCKGVR